MLDTDLEYETRVAPNINSTLAKIKYKIKDPIHNKNDIYASKRY